MENGEGERGGAGGFGGGGGGRWGSYFWRLRGEEVVLGGEACADEMGNVAGWGGLERGVGENGSKGGVGEKALENTL